MRILIVGLGSMGNRRLRNLGHLGERELAGFDIVAERRDAATAEHGIPVFAEFADALAWGPELVVISTPPDLHTPYALESARAGVGFFTEASVVADGMDELQETVAAAGVLAAPSCTMRFHPAVGVLCDRLAAGTVGTVAAVNHHCGQYLPDWHPWEDYRSFYAAKRSTGAAREMVAFELTWLTDVFGPVRSVQALRAKRSDLEIDIDDVYATVLGLGDGILCSSVVDVVSRPAVRETRVIGDRGTLVWDWPGRRVREWGEGATDWTDHPDPPGIEGPGGQWVAEDMYIAEMAALLAAARGEVAWPFSLADDAAILDVLRRIESASDAQG